jgi:ribosomal protein S5
MVKPLKVTLALATSSRWISSEMMKMLYIYIEQVSKQLKVGRYIRFESLALRLFW